MSYKSRAILLAALALNPAWPGALQQIPERAKPPAEKQEVAKRAPEDSAKPPERAPAPPSSLGRATVTSVPGQVNSDHQKSGNGQPEENWVNRLGTDPVATFTALLFVATFLLWLATKRLVSNAEKTAERQLRAYLGRGGKPEFRELIQPDQSKVYEFLVPVKNSGQTPAYKVVARGRAAFYSIPLPTDADLTLKPAPHGSRAPLGPGQEIQVLCASDAINVPEVLLMQRPRLQQTLYLVGIVEYSDAFGHRHELRFCEAVDWSYVHSVQYPTIPTYPVGSHNDGD